MPLTTDPKATKRVMKGNTRVTGKEQFYTPPEIATSVVSEVLARAPWAMERTWIEPCGGTGAFLDAFAAAGIKDYWSCDIEPNDPRVIEANFLSAHPPAAGCVTVTNPPFGRNNALSVPFFNHAATFSELIAFIVPRSWRKWSVINRLDASFHLVQDRDLLINYNDSGGAQISQRTSLQTCVQIWQRLDQPRPKVVIEDRGYIVRDDPEAADVSLTIFGHGCGTLKTVFERVPRTTQLFLKVRDQDVVRALGAIDYSRFYRNVAYTEALSIREIMFLLNEYFDREAGLPLAQRTADDGRLFA
jgi:predicted RNA methylase